MADVLTRTLRASFKLTRDGVRLYEQTYYDDDVDYTESCAGRLVLATNMGAPQEIELSGVTGAAGGTTGATLFLETDRDIKVAVNDIAALWPLSANGALLFVGDVTHLYVQNESTTNLATVHFVVTD